MIYREGSNIPTEKARELCSVAEATISAMDKAIASLSRMTKSSRISLAVELENLVNNDDEGGSIYSRIEPINSNLFACVRANALNLYKAASSEPATNPDRRVTAGEYDSENPANMFSDAVDVFFEKEVVFIKVPMLWTRSGRQIKDASGKVITPDKNTLFLEELSLILDKKVKENAAAIDGFRSKTISFLYVYDSLPNNKTLVADNSNHDIDLVQDTVTQYFPGGDDPLFCSVFQSSVVSKDVPSGTYLTIARGSQTIIPITNVIKFWTEKNSTKK